MTLQLFERSLEFNEQKFIIPVRADGYVNANTLCKTVGKLFADWKRLKSTEELIEALNDDLHHMGIPIGGLIDVGVQGSHSGTFLHPDLAVPFAMWCSPKFTLQVSRWIKELLYTGKVELNQKLLEESKEIEQLRLDNQNLEREVAEAKIPLSLSEWIYALTLDGRTYHKFGRTNDLERRKTEHKVYYGENTEYETKEKVYHGRLAEEMMKVIFEDNMVYDIYKQAKPNKLGELSKLIEETEGCNLPTDMIRHIIKRTSEVSNEFYLEMTNYKRENYRRIKLLLEQSAKDKIIHDERIKAENIEKKKTTNKKKLIKNTNDDEKKLVIYESSTNVNTNIVVYDSPVYPTLDIDDPIMPVVQEPIAIMPVVQEPIAIMPVVQEPIAIIKPVPIIKPVITNKVVVKKPTTVSKPVVKSASVSKHVIPKLDGSNTKSVVIKFIVLLSANKIEGYPKEGGEYKISVMQDAYDKFCDEHNYLRPKDYAQFWKSGKDLFYISKNKITGMFTAFSCIEIKSLFI